MNDGLNVNKGTRTMAESRNYLHRRVWQCGLPWIGDWGLSLAFSDPGPQDWEISKMKGNKEHRYGPVIKAGPKRHIGTLGASLVAQH